MMEIELFKSRSVTGCIADAYDFCIANYKKILKALLLPALAYGFLVSIVILTSIDINMMTGMDSNNIQMENIPYGSAALMTIAVLILIPTSVWLQARMCSVINNYPRKQNFKRCMTVFLLGVAVCIVGMIFIVLPIYLYHGDPGKVILGIFGAYIIFLILCVPFAYSSISYIHEPQTTIGNFFGKNYRTGLRHWGKLFLTFLLTMLIFYIIIQVLSIPAIIIMVAEKINSSGIAGGDPDGTTSTLTIIAAITFFVTYTIIAIISQWCFTVLYLTYSSIRARKEIDLSSLAETPVESIEEM